MLIKRMLSIFLVLLLPFCACAENTLPSLVLVTPTPAPEGEEYSCEAFIVRLPVGMEVLGEDERAGYDAAVLSAFPESAEIQLAAVHPGQGAALCFSLMDSALQPMEAAQEAAEIILGSAENAAPFTFGSNSCAGFACSVQDTAYSFYYFSNGSQLLLVSASGLSGEQISAMLSTLDF